MNNEHITLTEDGRTEPRINTSGEGVMRALINESRVLRDSIRLPMDEALTLDQSEEVRSKFKAYLYQFNISAAKAAKQVGFEPSVISQWMNCKYPGDNDEVTRSVNNWMREDSLARGLTLDIDYIPTAVCEGMRAAISTAHARSKMVACIMPAGTGKTKMIEMMAKELRGYVVYCHQDLTPCKFLEAVAVAVGARVKSSAMAVDSMNAIVAKIRGSRRPIFLDEAHLLRKNVFSRIRAIYDQTGVCVCMAGTEDIISAINDRAGGRGQMASRCMVYNALAYYSNIDDPGRQTLGQLIYTKEEIRSFLDAMKVKIDPNAFELLWAISCMPDRGCMRLVLDIIGTIILNCRLPRITRDGIWQALEIYDFEARQPIIDRAKELIDSSYKTMTA